MKFSPNSTEELEVEFTSVKTFPDPTVDRLNVEFPSEVITESVVLFNTLGNEEITLSVDGKSEIELDVSTLSPGVYMLVSTASSGVITQKILIQR